MKTREQRRELNERLDLYMVEDVQKEIKKILKTKELNVEEILKNRRFILNQLKNKRHQQHFKFVIEMLTFRLSTI